MDWISYLFRRAVSPRHSLGFCPGKGCASRSDIVLEAWDESASVTYDHGVWSEFVSLRFVEEVCNALISGPVGVGKTFLATALGHVACRRRIPVIFERASRLHKRLRVSRLDGSYEAEMRKLIGIKLIGIDDFALRALDAIETADIYELVIERHRHSLSIRHQRWDTTLEWVEHLAKDCWLS